MSAQLAVHGNIMEAKQKRQLITISLAGAVLLAGLVAGFLVVQNGVFIQNRASTGPISCVLLDGTCKDQSGLPHTLQVKEKGSGNIVGSGTSPVYFKAQPNVTYVCEIVSSADSTCRASSEMSGQACIPTRTDAPPTEPPTVITQPPLVPKTETPTPTVPARVNAPSTTPTSVLVTTMLSPTPTSKIPTPTTKTATNTPVPPTSGTGGSGITPTSLPTNAPTATAAAQATKAAATATQAAVQTQTSNPSVTKAASTTSLPASGNVHPALIFGMLSVFIIMLGLLF